MTRRFPWLETVLTSIAAGSLGTLWWLPPTPSLAPTLKPYALGLSAAWTLGCLWRLDRRLTQRRAWHVSPTWVVSPMAVTRRAGAFFGRGFRWEATHVEILERALLSDGGLPEDQGTRGGYPAIQAVGADAEEDILASWRQLTTHAVLMGTTGSGKSRGLESLLVQAMSPDVSGKTVTIFLDPKGDRGLFARAAAEAERHGKPFALVSPAFPAYSASFNPLASAETPLEIADRIQALTPNSREPFFESFSMAFITALAAAQQKIRHAWTLKGLHEVATTRTYMMLLLDTYLTAIGCYRPGFGVEHRIAEYEAQGRKDHTADALLNFARRRPQDFDKLISTLIPTFHGVVGDLLDPLLSPREPDLTWKKIIDHGMVVYFALGSMILGETANRIARTILQDFIGFIGRRYAYEDPAHMQPITVFVDEAGDVLYPEFINAPNKARGANVRFILAMQSRADAEAKLGKDVARQLFANLGLTCYFRLADQQTADTVLKGLTCRVQLPTPPMVGLGYGGVGGLSGHAQTGLQDYEVPAVRPGLLTALPIGEFFCLKGGILWKGRVPLLESVPQETLERLGLAAMWRAMDPHTVHEGAVVCDLPRSPSRQLAEPWPLPSSRQLPSPGATPAAGKSRRTPLRTYSQALRRVWRCVCAMGRRRVRPSRVARGNN